MSPEIKIDAAELLRNQQLPFPLTREIGPTVQPGDERRVFAVPDGWNLQTRDTEELLMVPRAKRGKATFQTLASFVDYLETHAEFGSTVVWVKLDPMTAALSLRAVIDDHSREVPHWRRHTAEYTPRHSVEWKTWSDANGKARAQGDFAAWIEDQLPDIASVPGLPTGADMLKLATDFEIRQEMSIKSAVRLQDGGVRLNYVADSDTGTVSQLEVFNRFAIGIPVYWGCDRYQIEAKLRYRAKEGKVVFWFELVRPHRIAEAAANDLIDQLDKLVSERNIPARILFGEM
ncbi:hypothetical protein X805_04640 [Sphaerotilus natans subsp. natans DSM 6575]|uniref:DUF2303 family protein n=1 Tax=Sphaerotilus natans subsp. natans DSM 6575 TaxID=1286631 RepID=A0A059KRB3_9BURK|nr:DUF2303 family protein [Sphaerotilus natans]KDB53910.1 hypothetical protein X805_04640 [Sphaerotilus natans subsp. natans DSM 6575]SIR68568.1 Uncharacterized conserved protein YfdQ, DUF2303 family [Sphaerotilus natans]